MIELKFKNLKEVEILRDFIQFNECDMENPNLYNLVNSILDQIEAKLSVKIARKVSRASIKLAMYESLTLVTVMSEYFKKHPETTSYEGAKILSIHQYIIQKLASNAFLA